MDETEYYCRIIGDLKGFEVLEPEKTRKEFEKAKKNKKR